MSTELAKTYDPASVEAIAYQTWLDEKCFVADPTSHGKSYTIVIPPPNVTGALHLGHAINNTLQDILIRMHRMAGFNTLWIPGLDHAGIATQAVVEKQLKENENKTRHDLGREALVERIWKWKQQYGDRILEQLKRLGCSCDWSRTRFTLDEMCAKAVRHTFFKLFKNSLIYRGKRLVNWDVFLQTSVSDDEIYHETVKTNLWHIRYPIVNADGIPVPAEPGRPTYMVVATTRPETLLGDTAVAVHPSDPRWNWAIGKFARLPLQNRLIPIVGDAILVNMEFGSGVVKVTPAHDPNDYAVWQRQAGNIDMINVLTPGGTINANGGAYSGLRRDVARKKIVEDLLKQGLLEKEEPYETQVGHSDRSKTPIEPYLSDQWFVRMLPLAEPALEAVEKGQVKFHPERYARTYLDWLGEKRDWPISRQLWWGHRLPVWRLKPLSEAMSSNDHERVQIVQLHPAVSTAAVEAEPLAPDAPLGSYLQNLAFCVDAGHPELERELEALGFEQDPDVLDTWFSSALWPYSTLGWPDNTPELKTYYPTAVLITARDIITLWVARMVMTGLYNMGRVPFHDVAINPTILDGKGERMSKSKGNGVDPVDIIDTHGADALRLTLANMATETQDARLPVKKDAQGRNTSDKFDAGRNFCNKLWNASRFVLSSLEAIGSAGESTVDESKWSLADRWIISRFNRTLEEANTALKTYRFDLYAKVCYDFFWRDFCDWYVEAVKPAMKDPTRSAQTGLVLAAVLDGALRLMHPVIPFITETIWWRLNDVCPNRGLRGRLECKPSARLVVAAWPTAGEAFGDAEHIFHRIQEVIGAIRNLRSEYNVKPSQTVAVTISSLPEPAQHLRDNREIIELLATCTLQQIGDNLPPPPDAARTTAAGCNDIFIEGLVDKEAEKQKAVKQVADLKGKEAAMVARLSNEAYISKAPAHLVQQTKDELEKVRAELAKLGG